MDSIRCAIVAATTFAAVVGSAGVWSFPGPRKTEISIDSEADSFQIVVSFRPVSAFDEGKNRIENDRFALSKARWGLFHELGGSTNQALTVSGLTLQAVDRSSSLHEYLFIVPTNSVRLEAIESGSMATNGPSFPPPDLSFGFPDDFSLALPFSFPKTPDFTPTETSSVSTAGFDPDRTGAFDNNNAVP